MTTPEQKKHNKRTAFILATVVAVFFIGFMVRMIYFSGAAR